MRVMLLNSAYTQMQLFGNVPIEQSLSQQLSDLFFPLCQRIDAFLNSTELSMDTFLS